MSLPIFWADKGTGTRGRHARRWNDKGELVPMHDDLGRPVIERVPNTGRVGSVREVSDIANTKPMREPRSVKVLRDDGHEVDPPIRSAAAAGHGDKGTDNSFERYLYAKAKFAGWIVNHACPVALVANAKLTAQQLYAPDNREAVKRGEACSPSMVGLGKPPCRHYLAERVARQAQRLKEHERQLEVHTRAEERTAKALTELVERGARVSTIDAPPAEKRPAKEPTK